ncbi:MAG: hypothetical protein KF760_30720 [Candidatus Eremiobacteraeota bacterium]|nr:hypothetical protein [Candidatus Eremiobacteraeota bacterium]MCW5868621.1 hypothetical protein [Candidatus Eremiobacteraeota bacterium]
MPRSSLKRRGIMIIVAMLVLGLLLILGMGILGSQQARYRAATRSSDAAQALCLAEAGLEDVRCKLEKDRQFPPRAADDQRTFSYSETLSNGPLELGSYYVEVDWSYDVAPYHILKITAIGCVGPRENPRAQRTLLGELRHISNASSISVAPPNPPGVTWSWVSMQDLSSL